MVCIVCLAHLISWYFRTALPLAARARDDFVSLTWGGPVGVDREEEEEVVVVKVGVGLVGEAMARPTGGK